MEAHRRMTCLTSVTGTFRARVLGARLTAEGIDAQLRGAIDAPYGFTVGDMARVDVFVPEDQLDDARYVLLADEVDASLAAPTEWWHAGSEDGAPRRRWVAWVACTLLGIAVVAPALGYAWHW